MMRTRLAALSGMGALALLLAGCATSAGGSDAESGGGDALGLIEPGTLTVCVNLESPPNVYAEADGTPVGVEVDLAKDMAEQMDLDIAFSELSFAGLIPALQAQQCDTIISSLYIKPEREEIASFVPYLLSGSGILVAKDNPAGVEGYDDSLCGTKAIGINGATGAGLLEEQSTACTAAGEPGIDVTLTDKAADALQQVIAGQQDVYLDTAEGAAYFAKQSEGRLVPVGETVGEIQIGAASLKSNAALHDALTASFAALQEDGTYQSVLDTWGFDALDIANASS
ncbi:ABC transporter substrate-binding protein [Rathayibacter sp. VKM Ac-2805]|uniref:ABC transporter substrate-binding protein n=1 Tax=Rathayibacter sp. VKM Ac-2805 TaxID=2609258 RepID=UPI00131FD8CC|nr:ABC transporter substrate-binding protein [Rathayibacter sp. VKM Ac-2805]QHC75097.1 transporter substrate-binding domain-containing protein [Rathayibacter sp. VKM Ac-2805]